MAALKHIWGILRSSIANSVTLPYYRFYRHNTLLPILAIKKSVEDGESPEAILERLRFWQDRKMAEYKLTAAAVISPISIRQVVPVSVPLENTKSRLMFPPEHSSSCGSNRLFLLAGSGYYFLAGARVLVFESRFITGLGALSLIRGLCLCIC